MSTQDDARRLATSLPSVTERLAYGTPAFYVAGSMFARVHDQPGVLMCWRDCVESREELIAADPEKFFTTDHYRGHPSVLLRLDRVEVQELHELLVEAWEARATPRLLASSRPRSAGPGDAVESNDLPPGLGAVALRALAEQGVTRLEQVATFSERDLLALHGVGPKTLRVLQEELRSRGSSLRDR